MNTSSSYCVDVRSVELDQDELSPDKIVSGEPQMFSRVFSASYNGNVIRGVWRLTEGQYFVDMIPILSIDIICYRHCDRCRRG